MSAEHVTVTVRPDEFAAAAGFYDAALGSLGWSRQAELVDEEEDDAAVEAIGWNRGGGGLEFWLVIGPTPTTGLHLRLMADSRLDVETFFGVTVESGGTVYAAPRRWTPYRRGEFGATVADPAGNLIEAVAPE